MFRQTAINSSLYRVVSGTDFFILNTQSLQYMAGEIILAVDDLPQNLMTIKLGLRKFDYTFHSASNGDEALELLQTLRPDVILMDIQMPHATVSVPCRSSKKNAGNAGCTCDFPVGHARC